MKKALITGLLTVTSFVAAGPAPQSAYYQDPHHYEHQQTKKKTVERVGGGAAAGAVAGALLGGGKGAAIGAGAGAGAGALIDHHKRSVAKKKDAQLRSR